MTAIIYEITQIFTANGGKKKEEFILKRKTRTRALSWLLSLSLMLSLLSGMSVTALAAETSLDSLTSDYTAQNGETLTGTLGGEYKISIADGAAVTLKDAAIIGTFDEEDDTKYSWAGITCEGNATIILDGTNTVLGFNYSYPGIYVPDGKTLTIQGEGSLEAASNGFAAGIGGGMGLTCGNIVIQGGEITATGGDFSAAIGSGALEGCGDITVKAGTVTANGGDGAGAIGSGRGGSCGSISIEGGKVTAVGSEDGDGGAGIGTGRSYYDDENEKTYTSQCSDITISGGVVDATGGYGSAGIGTGYNGDTQCGNITISGGKVTAVGGIVSAGIGTGGIDTGDETGNICGDITISGGEVEATSVYMGGAAIGSGSGSDFDSHPVCGNITISNGTVRATGYRSDEYSFGAGIGTGYFGSCGDIAISGGDVTAAGGNNGAGIGTGVLGSCGSVNISGGEVEAAGRGGAAGIGSGGGGLCEAVTIANTVTQVIASKGDDALHSVGMGMIVEVDEGVNSGSCGTVTVGGTVFWNGTEYQNDGETTIAQSTFAYPHLHVLTGYKLGTTNAENDTITGTCTDKANHNDGQNYEGSLVISAPTEGGGAATLSNDARYFGVSASDIKYYSGAGWSNESETPPSADGFYKASITVGTGENTMTASVTYGVNAISVAEGIVNGTLADPPTVATVGAAVTINTTPAVGYELDSMTVTKAGGGTVSVTKNGNSADFIMPEDNVTVSAAFALKSYSIAVDAVTNGSVKVKNNGGTEISTAKMGDTVTIECTTDEWYDLKSVEVNNGTVTVFGTGNTRTFTMPSSDVTVSASIGPHDFVITKNATENGSLLVNETANVGETVTITVQPDAGYVAKTVTVGGNEITPVGGVYSFTMPLSDVTVGATFIQRDVPVKLTTVNDEAASGKAMLLNTSYETMAADGALKLKTGDSFVLSAACDEAYDFAIAGSTDIDFRELTIDEKRAYIAKNADADANTHLFMVTMPAVASEHLTVTVEFREIKVYTVLYQPTASDTSEVWCKCGNDKAAFVLKMNSAATIGSEKVYSINVSMPFAPTKVAFADSSEALADADLANISVSETAVNVSSWPNVTGGKCIVIGGHAKVVVAAFVKDVNNLAVYDDESKIIKGNGSGAEYQIAVCLTNENGAVTTPGTVTAPAALGKEGFTFGGWRGFEGTAPNAADKTYQAGTQISVSSNAIFGCVWNPVRPDIGLYRTGGTGGTDIDKVDYKEILQILENPQRSGFVFHSWAAGKNVVENRRYFAKGAPFDLDTPITADLDLYARWKHVHSYTRLPLNFSGFGDSLKGLYAHLPHVHVCFCGCGDIDVELHTFRNGVCTGCGYTLPGATEAKLDVSYWKDGASKAWIQELPRTEKINNEVTVSADYYLGDYEFSKWQYSVDNGASWVDLASANMVGFIIPRSMQVRAIYVNPITEPQVSMSARSYMVESEGYNWDSVLYQMEYKLPDGYTYVDAGVKLGDNQGISFYDLKKRQKRMLMKAAETGAQAVSCILSGPLEYAIDSITEEENPPEYIIEKREDSVLKTMSAAELAGYMYENKPVNVPEYEPIYWQTRSTAVGQSGYVNTLTPLRFIQKNNGNHFIYGMAYLSYKTPEGKIETIYTEALPTTRDNVPAYTVKADPKGMTNTKQQ